MHPDARAPVRRSSSSSFAPPPPLLLACTSLIDRTAVTDVSPRHSLPAHRLAFLSPAVTTASTLAPRRRTDARPVALDSGQMLQWPKYGQLRDTAEVLLAESGETYAFIDKVRARSLVLPSTLARSRLARLSSSLSSQTPRPLLPRAQRADSPLAHFLPPCKPPHLSSPRPPLPLAHADDPRHLGPVAQPAHPHRHGRGARRQRGAVPPAVWVQGQHAGGASLFPYRLPSA